MVRGNVLAVAAIMLATCWLPPARGVEEESTIVWNKELTSAREAVEQQRPVLLYLTLPGCAYCQRMKAETFAEQSIVEQIVTEYVPVELNGNTNAELARLLKIRVYPTTALIASNGQVVDILHGYKSPAAFRKRLEAVQAKIRVSRGDAKDVAPVR